MATVGILWRLNMAFELIGKKPKSSLGKHIRINIWKWYEFILMLEYLNILKKSELSKWMFNEEIILSNQESKLLHDAIVDRLGKSFEKIIEFESYLRSIEGQKKYSKHKGYSNFCCQILNETDIKYILYFLDNSGGFKVV